ncbi:MAG: ABC transporter permease [Bryobacteraceae bacterium]|nr:ABC transporter permease [Bryobacteraceae bacterium]
MPYLAIFYRLIVRPLRSEPVRTGLTALAVALGVAVVLAIELAGEAAAGSFRSSMETLTGKADFEITGTAGVPPQVLARLATLPYDLKLRPRIEDYVIVSATRRTVPFIAVDVLTDVNAEDVAQGENVTGASTAFASENSVWAGKSLGWKAGDKVKLLINDTEGEYTIGGVLPESAGDVIVTDIAPASRILRRATGTLDRILIETRGSGDSATWERILREAAGREVTVNRFGSRTEENRKMLAAFRWNLRVLSYIALVVGAFLIYNTVSVSVVRRRNEIGILRALGATRWGVLAAFLGEAACFGLVGGIVGLLLGRLMAESAVGLVAVTVDALYVSSTPGDIALTPVVALIGILIGLGVSIASAFAPAWEASLVPPVEAMSRGRADHQTRTRFRQSLILTAVLCIIAAALATLPAYGDKPVFGYLSALALIGALAAGIAPLVATFSRVLTAPMRALFGVEGLLATRSLQASLRRTSVLAGALATAIAMTASVGIMVGSFRETVLVWMEDRLKADLYIRPAGPVGVDRHPTMAADSAERLRALPEVAAVDTFRAYEITYNGRPATLAGGESQVSGEYTRRAFVSGSDVKRIFDELATKPDAAIVSEPFASKHNVHAGDRLKLQLDGRDVTFRVLDIYYDYTSERGYIIVDRRTLLRYLPDPAPSNAGVYLKPGVSIEKGKDAVENALAGRRVLIFSNRSLREEAMRTFDRTFSITYALEGVAVFVAIMGVAGALLALVIDRRREFGLLRFMGGATGQIQRLILFEAGLLGLLANIAGLGLGVLLSLLLIYVINKQSFGWTIQFHWPVAMLLGSLTLVFVATVAAALYPARVATRLNPIEVIHEE